MRRGELVLVACSRELVVAANTPALPTPGTHQLPNSFPFSGGHAHNIQRFDVAVYQPLLMHVHQSWRGWWAAD